MPISLRADPSGNHWPRLDHDRRLIQPLEMKKFIIGTKQSMTQLFTEEGFSVPVTVVEAKPSVVTQIKTSDKEGYTAVQVGYGSVKAKNVAKPQQGHYKKVGEGSRNFAKLKEFRVDDVMEYKVGNSLTVAQFSEGDTVKITGVSKGKGFQGVVRRHHFRGHPSTHGHKDQLRMPGSIGATAPQRVFKGTRMGGHMGDDQVTVINLKIVKVDEAANQIYLRGAVPGARGSYVTIYA